MQLDTPQSDGSSRLRLVDVRVDAARGHLHLGAHLSGVLAGTSSRSEAARWIATTVAGPRPADAGGSVEIEGHVASVWTLPAEMLPPSSPVVIDLAVVHAQWQASWCRRRDELAAAHASCRLEGYRIEAALERARDRLPLPGAPVGSAAPLVVGSSRAPEAQRAPEPEAESFPPIPEAPIAPPPEEAAAPEADMPPVDWALPPDVTTHTRAKVRTLLATLDAMQPAPLPEGLLLADAWDAHAALLRARQAADELPIDDIEALEQRVNAARGAVDKSSRSVTEAARLHIEQCHRVVVETEAALFEAKRKQRSAALARYDEAVAAELVALADAGLDSYAAFLFEITSGHETADLGARLAAETELAAARTALDAARQVPSVPTRVELEEREVQMRARATELLGHAPGANPAAELRALRVEAEGSDETIAEIAEALSHGGVAATDDVVERARAFLAVPLAAPPAPQPATEPAPQVAPLPRVAFEAPPAWVEPPATRAPAAPVRAASQEPVSANVTADPARWREVADLEERRSAQNRKLAQLEAELARVDRMNEAGVARLDGTELSRALESLLAAYRAGDLLDGRLPLILDGVLDGLTADAREAAVAVFARATDVQTVVVTDDPEVMQSLSRKGGTLVRWPEPLVTISEEPERRPAPTRSA